MPDTISETPSAAETSVRQLIFDGKSKAALDRAKEVHKQRPDALTETLLVDAYCARIGSLLEHKMAVEAKALIEVVRQKFPAHSAKLEGLGASAEASAGSFDALLAPLNDASLDPAKRAVIESAIQREICDLRAIAGCAALPPEHALRTAAAALDRALRAVTSGAVEATALELPEVSRRSPLAPWKPLIAAIGCLYGSEDGRCREYLSAVAPGSAAARLVPAIEAALGDKPSARLTAGAAILVNEIRTNVSAMRAPLDNLEKALKEDSDARVLRAVQTVFQQCLENAPELAGKLRQHVAVRCALRSIDQSKTVSAMGGQPRTDFHFRCLFAKGLETQDEPEALGVANATWDEALKLGVKERLFTANGPEAAEIYLHMAEVMEGTPRHILDDIQRGARRQRSSPEEFYFLFPEQLYQRVAAIHPDSEVFSRWLEWSKRTRAPGAEPVAQAWHKACPGDIQPLLYLIEAKARRKAYADALKYLAAAERIDGIHPVVRMMRVRLLTGNLLNQLKKKNPRRAEETLCELAELPAVREGDRPAFVAALRCLAARIRQDEEAAEAARKEVETLLGDRMAARILLCALSPAAKLTGECELDVPLSAAGQDFIPAGLARTFALGRYFGLEAMRAPVGYASEAVKQLAGAAGSIDLQRIRVLAEESVAHEEFELAYAAAGAGMERGGASEARFLLLRAQSLPDWQQQRKIVCAAAAATLARARGDTETVKKAVETLHEMSAADFPIEADDASEMLGKERKARAFPQAFRPGPDYSRFFAGNTVCDCAECRRGGGEAAPDEEDDEEDLVGFLDDIKIPPGIPPELGKVLLDGVKSAIASGISPDEFMREIFGEELRGGSSRKKKGKGK